MLLPSRHKDKRTTAVCALGYFLRCVPAFLCAYGFTRFVYLSVGIYLPEGLLISVCLLFCVMFSVMELNDKLFFGGTVLFIAAAVYAVNLGGGIKNTALGIGTAFYNACLKRLDVLGYPDAGDMLIDFGAVTDTPLGEYEMLIMGGILLAFLICSMVVLLSVRKAYIVPIAATLSIILVFVFYFGMGDDTLSFATALCGFCGCAALARYDGVFVNRNTVSRALGQGITGRSAEKEIDSIVAVNSAMGGYHGICAVLIAFLLILIPAGVHESMIDIPTISTPLTVIEDRIVASWSGYSSYEDGISFAELYANQPRTTAVSERNYSGKIMITLETDTNTPIYLRSWIGTSYKNDSWSIVSEAETDEYRRYFGTGFSPELLTYELLQSVFTADEGKVQLPECTLADVNITTLTNSASALLLPSHTDPRKGLRKYGSDEQLTAAIYNYYEGIFVSGSKYAPEKYGVSALIAREPTEESITMLSEIVRYYNGQQAIIASLRRLISQGGNDLAVVALYEQIKYSASQDSSAYAVFTPPSEEDSAAYRYAYSMSDVERTRINALTDNIPMYNDYVFSYYLELCEGADAIRELAGSIVKAPIKRDRNVTDKYIKQHEAVLAVIDYLEKNMTYTLSPQSPSDQRQYINSADTFLFDTHEGYCVQYATSAAMLLRALNIPTRYAQGYVANEFSINEGEEAAYYSEVPDSNAHAWIEVYYEGFGWVRYEVTSAFGERSDSSYARSEITTAETSYRTEPQTSRPLAETTRSVETYETIGHITEAQTVTELPTQADDISFEEIRPGSVSQSQDDKTNVLPIIIVSVSVVAVSIAAIVVCVVICRANSKEKRRRSLIRRACTDRLSDEDALYVAVQMGDGIMKLLAYLKLTPQKGEFAGNFAIRVDSALEPKFTKSFLGIIGIIQSGEFGNSVSHDELRRVAEYYNDLYDFIVSKKGKMQAFYVKYFLMFS